MCSSRSRAPQRRSPVDQHAQRMTLALQAPFDPQQWCVAQHVPVPFIDAGPHDQVDQPLLVLQGDKDVSFGWVGSLHASCMAAFLCRLKSTISS